ncbi:uncharacterized protein V1510DRAFT_404430 [Dipodascopsis tothii]|uniref:uncharacterized protein n=1 Tax=Dipodascopsis tothii TaxID=44089 RepID=UPI0034CF40C6
MRSSSYVVIFVRLAQFVFAAIVIGDLAYAAHTASRDDGAVPTSYEFNIAVSAVALVAAIVVPLCTKRRRDRLATAVADDSKAVRRRWLVYYFWYLADVVVALMLLAGFVWVVCDVMPLDCTWAGVNPFSSSACLRMRAALLFDLIGAALSIFSVFLEGCLWIRARVSYGKL